MTPNAGTTRVWAVIPAAGTSRRMGFSKQTAAVQGTTMVSMVVRTLLDAAVAGVVVVTRTQLVDDLALPSDARVRVAINDDPDSEMIDSIRIGCAACVAADSATDDPSAPTHGIMIVPADMPSITVATFRACLQTFGANPERIVIAAHHGKRGHPIIFPMAMCAEATSLPGGLRMISRAHADRVVVIDTHDAGTTLDVDTPRDFESLSPTID